MLEPFGARFSHLVPNVRENNCKTRNPSGITLLIVKKNVKKCTIVRYKVIKLKLVEFIKKYITGVKIIHIYNLLIIFWNLEIKVVVMKTKILLYIREKDEENKHIWFI